MAPRNGPGLDSLYRGIISLGVLVSTTLLSINGRLEESAVTALLGAILGIYGAASARDRGVREAEAENRAQQAAADALGEKIETRVQERDEHDRRS